MAKYHPGPVQVKVAELANRMSRAADLSISNPGAGHVDADQLLVELIQMMNERILYFPSRDVKLILAKYAEVRRLYS